MNKWLGFFVVLAIFIATLVFSYNGLVQSKEEIATKEAVIDVQLKRRGDLIGNLVESVKGYAAHESELIHSVSTARAKLVGVMPANEKAAAYEAASGALARLIAIAESYPELKADSNFRHLSDELAGTENRISVARIDYNNAVAVYNKKIISIPTKFLADYLGFEKASYFVVAEADKAPSKISFGTDK